MPASEDNGPITSLRDARRAAGLSAPLHPILVHFTIALTSTSLVFDAVALLFGVEALADAAWWTLAASVAATVFTVATGVASRIRIPVEEGEARSFLRAHMLLGPAFFGALLAVAVWRGALWEADTGPTWGYLAAMAATAAVMAAQGYLGGELVYRYGMEVDGSYRALPGHAPRAERSPLHDSRTGIPRAGMEEA